MQIAYFEVIDRYGTVYPSLSLIWHCPNGEHRTLRTGKLLKAMGVKRGVPDVFVAFANKEYHGLFIEFKSLIGSQSSYQKEWQVKLVAQGYKYEVHRSWVTAWNATILYLNLPKKVLIV